MLCSGHDYTSVNEHLLICGCTCLKSKKYSSGCLIRSLFFLNFWIHLLKSHFIMNMVTVSFSYPAFSSEVMTGMDAATLIAVVVCYDDDNNDTNWTCCC